MKKLFILILFPLILTGCAKQAVAPASNYLDNKINIGHMKLFSNDFQNNGKMDPRFTCDGGHTRPHLAWSEIPEGAKSLSLAMFDPDAPGDGFLHWLVVNLPAQEMELNSSDALPAPAKQIRNDAGQLDYYGPCPPSGEHRYIFTLYALDTERIEPADYQEFLDLTSKHLVGKAEIIGLYQRQ